MKPVDFNSWRSRYDSMTRDDHIAFYSACYTAYPEQRCFHPESVLSFIERFKPASVVEIGGWNGELAQCILNESRGIVSWLNFDICLEAIENSVCKDHRYIPVNSFMDRGVSCDALVMSHTLEHMKMSDFESICSLCSFECAYIDSPIRLSGEQPDPWSSYLGTHIMGESWCDIRSLMSKSGYASEGPIETKGSNAFIFWKDNQ